MVCLVLRRCCFGVMSVKGGRSASRQFHDLQGADVNAENVLQ